MIYIDCQCDNDGAYHISHWPYRTVSIAGEEATF